MTRVRVLGVDPGSRNLGFGIVEKSGNQLTVLTHGTVSLFHKEYKNIEPDETTPSRLKEIYTELSQVIQKYKPSILAVEKVFFAKNALSALKLGQARGVVLVVGAMHDLEIYEYSATEIKSKITGHGRAEKEQVAKMLELMLGKQNFATLDASDALAIAVSHVLQEGHGTHSSTQKRVKKTKHKMSDIFAAKLSKKI